MENDKKMGFPFTVRDMLAFQHGAAFSLKIKTISNITDTLIIRGMTSEGIFSFRQEIDPDTGPFTNVFRIPDIPIWLSVTTEDLEIYQGDVYTTIAIEINGDTLYELCAGFVYNGKSLSWPYNNSIDKRPGGGSLSFYLTGDPAAGAEISTTVPAGKIWLIKSLRFRLVTSATVAARRVHIQIQNQADLHLHIPSTVTQAASLTYEYNLAPFGQYITAALDNDVLVNLPKDMLIPEGDTIATSTTNLQAGDNFSQMLIEYEQFFT